MSDYNKLTPLGGFFSFPKDYKTQFGFRDTNFSLTLQAIKEIANRPELLIDPCTDLIFDGIDDYVTFPDSNDFSLVGTDLTIEFKMYLDVAPSNADYGGAIISHDEGPGFNTPKWVIGYGHGGQLLASNNCLWLHICGPGYGAGFYIFKNIAVDLSLQHWHNIAITRAGTIWRLFVDGNRIAEEDDSRDLFDPSGPLLLGFSETFFPYFRGRLSEVHITKHAKYVDSNYSAVNTIVPDTGSVALWHLSEGTGTFISDSDDSHSGTMIGPAWLTNCASPKTYLNFDGIDDKVSIPDSNSFSLSSDSFTIETKVRINFQPTSPYGYVFAAHDQAQGGGPGTVPKWFLGYGSGGSGMSLPNNTTLYLHIYDAVAVSQIFLFDAVPITLSLNEEHHIAVTRTGNTFYLHVDGNRITSGSSTLSLDNPSAPLVLGFAEPAVPYLKGKLRDFHITRTPKYTNTLYSVPDTIPVDINTIGLWRLNEGTGSVVYDISGNGFSGSIIGAASWSIG